MFDAHAAKQALVGCHRQAPEDKHNTGDPLPERSKLVRRQRNQMPARGCEESPNSSRCRPILLISDRYRLDILRLSLFR